MENLIGSLDECLPPAYFWVESLKVLSNNGFIRDGWNLIPVQQKGEDIQFLSQGLGPFASSLKKSLDDMDWQVSETCQRLVVDEIPVLLVAISKVEAGAVKLSRQVGIDAASSLGKTKIESLNILEVSQDLILEDIFEGVCIGMDGSNAFKSNKPSPNLKSIAVPEAAIKACELRKKLAKSIIFSKWLQDAPSNFLNPEQFAAIANKFFASKADVKILGRDDMKEEGMGAFLAVAAGVDSDPKLVTIAFKGKDSSKTVALAGKGVTFDAGGINIKPTAGLEDMKYDMSGAAAVYGAAHYFCEVQPPVSVICAIGAVENMVSGNAMKPGDIVRSSSGKTIEIINTDAEGRLVLADVLTHLVSNFSPDWVIDIATLTGAAVVGLGHAGAAFMTPNEDVASYLSKVSEDAGEPIWRLPLWPELVQELVSKNADLLNLPNPGVKAGSIIGGLFLHEFVKDASCQWAHIDIAGTAWNCSSLGYTKKGGSGFGVRTLIAACQNFET